MYLFFLRNCCHSVGAIVGIKAVALVTKVAGSVRTTRAVPPPTTHIHTYTHTHTHTHIHTHTRTYIGITTLGSLSAHTGDAILSQGPAGKRVGTGGGGRGRTDWAALSLSLSFSACVCVVYDGIRTGHGGTRGAGARKHRLGGLHGSLGCRAIARRSGSSRRGTLPAHILRQHARVWAVHSNRDRERQRDRSALTCTATERERERKG
jgi:hypothetical protein